MSLEKHHLHIISSSGIGGAEKMLLKLLQENRKDERIKSYVLCLESVGALGSDFERLCEKVWFLETKNLFSLNFLKVIRQIRHLPITSLVGWMYRGMLASWVLSLFVDAKLIWTVRKSLNPELPEKATTKLLIRLLGFLAKQPKCIIYNSKDAIKMHAQYGFSKSKSVFIPNGFTAPKKVEVREKNAFRKELGVGDQAFLIGVLARYHECKGHINIVHSATKILKKFPHAIFVFVGKGFGEEDNPIKLAVKGLQLNEAFRFKGAMLEPSSFFCSCDLILSPSYIEGFSNTVGEALFYSKPVLASTAGDSEYILGNSKLTFNKGDAHSLYCKVIDYMQSPLEYLPLFELSYERAKEEFGMPKVARSYNNVIS